MATNYPTSIDTFVNPTSNDSLNAPSHSQQHTNLNDAMVAVQTKLGSGTADKVGMYLIKEFSFTTAASVDVNNIFSSTYDRYKFEFNFLQNTSAGTITFTFVNGSTPSASNWGWNNWVVWSNASSGASSSGGAMSSSSITVGDVNATHTSDGTFIVANPALAKIKFVHGHQVATGSGRGAIDSFFINGILNNTTVFEGLRLSVSGGTMTGTLRIYGLRNS